MKLWRIAGPGIDGSGSGTVTNPVAHFFPPPFCQTTFDQGFAPINDLDQGWEFGLWNPHIPDPPQSFEWEENRHRIYLIGQASQGDDISGSRLTGLLPNDWFMPPTQLSTCGRAFEISFDYSIELVDTEATFDYAQFSVHVNKTYDPVNFETDQIDAVIYRRDTVGVTSGTHTFTFSAGDVAEGEFVTISFDTFIYLEAGTDADRSGEIILENFAIG